MQPVKVLRIVFPAADMKPLPGQLLPPLSPAPVAGPFKLPVGTAPLVTGIAQATEAGPFDAAKKVIQVHSLVVLLIHSY